VAGRIAQLRCRGGGKEQETLACVRADETRIAGSKMGERGGRSKLRRTGNRLRIKNVGEKKGKEKAGKREWSEEGANTKRGIGKMKGIVGSAWGALASVKK